LTKWWISPASLLRSFAGQNLFHKFSRTNKYADFKMF
jgi:hypothetical protein